MNAAGQAMMRAVAYNEELAERVRAALADRTDVEEKKMFGGLSFMVAGQMCCGVLKNDLIVRIEPAEFDKLVAQPHVAQPPQLVVQARSASDVFLSDAAATSRYVVRCIVQIAKWSG